jgi:hypothetical protein
LFFAVIRSFHIRHQFEANCEWQTAENETQSAGGPQRDDEQIRRNRVDVESIGTATRFQLMSFSVASAR